MWYANKDILTLSSDLVTFTMAPNTDTYLPKLPEHHVAKYQELMKDLVKTKSQWITNKLVRGLDCLLIKSERRVRVLEAMKNGHTRSEHDPKLYKINYKRRDTFRQFLMKACRVFFRLFELEFYYGVLEEPLKLPTLTGNCLRVDIQVGNDLTTLYKNIKTLYSYLNPTDIQQSLLNKLQTPENLPHVVGPVDIEELRKVKEIARQKFKEEQEKAFKARPPVKPLPPLPEKYKGKLHLLSFRKQVELLFGGTPEEGF